MIQPRIFFFYFCNIFFFQDSLIVFKLELVSLIALYPPCIQSSFYRYRVMCVVYYRSE